MRYVYTTEHIIKLIVQDLANRGAKRVVQCGIHLRLPLEQDNNTDNKDSVWVEVDVEEEDDSGA